MIQRPNPFLGYGEVVYGERFVGRDHGLSLVRDFLSEPAAGSSIAIVGLPKVGKSSLLHQALMEDESRLIESRVLPLWMNVFQYLTGAELMRAMVSRTMHRLVWHVENPASIETAAREALTAADTWSDLMHYVQEFFAEVRRQSWRPLFVLDEFDAARQLYGGQTSVFQGLRELATNPRFKVVFATVSRRPVSEIERDTDGGSNLSEVLHKYRMPLFTTDETERLLQRLTHAGVEVTDAIRARAAQTCGGHPYLLNRLCYELAEHAREGRPPDLDQACSFPGAGESFTHHYQSLEAFLQDMGLYGKLLEIVFGPRVSVDASDVHALLAYGVIRPAEGGGFEPFSQHYHDYLGQQARTMDLWPLWSEVERRVRTLLLREFTAKYGDEWPDGLAGAHNGIADVIERCRRREAAAQGTRTGGAHSLLEFLDPSDLWRLLKCEWSLFVGTFGRTRSYWATRFNDILPLRTAMAHNRDFSSPSDRMRAEAACRDILASLEAAGR